MILGVILNVGGEEEQWYAHANGLRVDSQRVDHDHIRFARRVRRDGCVAGSF